MIREEFSFGASVMHRLDPRLKLLAATGFSIVVALSTRWMALAGALIFASVLLMFARLPVKSVGPRLFAVNAFVGLFWVMLPLSVSGSPLYSAGPVSVSLEGFALAGRLTLKSNSIVMAFMALAATSSIGALGAAMNRLRFPEKLTLLFLLTYRYLFVIQEEYERLKRAALMRGFKPKTDLHTYRTYAYWIAVLFVRASARAQRVQDAMTCRGFSGKFHTLREDEWTFRDSAWSVVLTAMVLVLVMVEWSPVSCS
ncbi:MAG: cobalt ECF transporter T component CbiQ [Deltaproteobacteria bacterium]|nr:cobalt ECF transporter T component CbiQ [Deltaproteobacteria bacterium]MBW2042095.1 cobalt ECF transporter T component CbiQ [Deltaproteobacteria bacterium]MBW2132588.1 cobalt ECF transporter T component CbiQ [Deltaproteobacteria bacterium]